MSKGIDIPLVADVGKFIKGTDSVSDALDDVVDSLDDVAREGKSATGKVSDALDTVKRDATTSSDTLEKKFRTAFDEVKADAKTTSTSVSTHMKRGADDAGEATKEFKNEAAQNFSEVASSFQGDMASAADGVQGTLGGLAGSLPGPAGIMAGVLAGVGGAMLTSFTKNAEASEARIKAMYDDMLESGNDFISQDAIQKELAAIYSDTGERAISWKNLKKIVEDTGASESLVARAYAGDIQAQRDLLGLVGDAIDANTDKTLNGSTEGINALIAQRAELERVRDGVVGIMNENDTAVKKVNGYRDAVSEMSGVTQSEQRAIAAGYDNFPREIKTTITAVADIAQAKKDLEYFARQSYTSDFRLRVGKAVI